MCGDLGITATLCLGMASGQKLEENSHIVIATPNAFLSNFAPKIVRGKQQPGLHSPADVKLLIVDEADFFYIEQG